jgi:hypothetical protein
VAPRAAFDLAQRCRRGIHYRYGRKTARVTMSSHRSDEPSQMLDLPPLSRDAVHAGVKQP